MKLPNKAGFRMYGGKAGGNRHALVVQLPDQVIAHILRNKDHRVFFVQAFLCQGNAVIADAVDQGQVAVPRQQKAQIPQDPCPQGSHDRAGDRIEGQHMRNPETDLSDVRTFREQGFGVLDSRQVAEPQEHAQDIIRRPDNTDHQVSRALRQADAIEKKPADHADHHKNGIQFCGK